jgi:hypothetical protein
MDAATSVRRMMLAADGKVVWSLPQALFSGWGKRKKCP